MKQTKKGYIIHKTTNKILLCKVLNEYNSEQDADKDLVKLLTNNTSEENLLKEYTNKESF
jgi:hypothetical protein